jgi:transcription antitermination factor NusG
MAAIAFHHLTRNQTGESVSEPIVLDSRPSQWYALRTRARHEKVVRDQLAARGVEPLLPTFVRLSQWKDRKKEIQLPLFPGYCFAKFSWQDRLPVLQAPGVVEVVGQAGRPVPVSETEIASIRTLLSCRRCYDPYPYLLEGRPVEVIRGPLQGIKGHLIRRANHHRLVISVQLIQQAAAVEIDATDVAPI